MNALMSKKHQTRALIMKALAHPSRIMMIEELGKGPRCVCELQRLVGSDISTVSKHLSVLKNAGLVYDIKQGTTVYYNLKVECALDFIVCVDKIINSYTTNTVHISFPEVPRAKCCAKLKQ